jgi:NAD(P)-dependent dehydrogenase (short-subunit alcohol dehydrogenase family)
MAEMKALVTGGTRGIGAAIAARLRDDGYEVTVTGTLKNGQAPQGCRFQQCDFSKNDQVARFAKQAAGAGYSVLVNNAGVNTVAPLQDYALQDFLWVQQVNVTAPFLLCKALVPGMRKRGFGRIVNITSIYGVVSRAGRSAYSTSKFGLFGMSRALALEAAADNVLVNCLAPGFVDTELTRRILKPKGMAEMARQVPMGRLAKAEEIAEYVRFLVSPDNTYMTGQSMVVDGGFTCA